MPKTYEVDILFDRISDTPRATELAQSIRRGYRKYGVNDCLNDLADLVVELANGTNPRIAMAAHPLAVMVADKRQIVAEHRERYGGGLTLLDSPRNAEGVTVTLDLGSRGLAERV